MIELAELTEKLRPEFERQLVPSKILLDSFRLSDEASRKSGAYQDPRHLPFYYHLAKFCTPKSLLEIGFRLGLASGCFLKKCNTVEKFLAFQETLEEGFYSPRLAKANIHDVYKGEFDFYIGQFTDQEFLSKMSGDWDMALINEDVGHDKHKNCLDLAWKNLSHNGLMVVDHVRKDNKSVRDSFESFCKIHNRTPAYFNTRYGTGIVQK